MKSVVCPPKRGAAARAGLALVALAALAALLSVRSAHAAEVIHTFQATYEVRTDGTVDVTEEILYDFGTAERHGIFRNLSGSQACKDAPAGSEQRVYPCPEGKDRVWQYQVHSVSIADGAGQAPDYQPVEYQVSDVDGGVQIKIGDPDTTVTGAHWYRIHYTIAGALDAYPSHDELYWNTTGLGWDVSMETVSVTVQFPRPVDLDVTCFEGASRSNQPCRATSQTASGSSSATYVATRVLGAHTNLTIVAGWPRGIVEVAPPFLQDQTSIDDFIAFEPIDFAGFGLVLLGSIAALAAVWWRHGRDRRYRSIYYLTQDPSEETKPLFGRTDVVVEYLPPDSLRPAQMGVILDERADTLDVTATVIDLAVRGYLHITEIPKHGVFGKTDWLLERLKEADAELLPYEAKLLDGLFEDGSPVKISDLKNKFVTRLKGVEELLYKDAMERKWFAEKPETAKNIWLGVGIGVIVVGAGLTVLFGWLGHALIPMPLVLAGIVLVFLSRAMARRTATGSEALRRVLGFRLYVATAETRRQEFNEQKGIFARYLPFAIVFGCVDKWAKAFRGLDDEVAQSTAGWYTGVGAFQVMAFSEGLRGFSSSVSSSISSSPSSGGSGFSGGGFSGGGGGGGGGGSW